MIPVLLGQTAASADYMISGKWLLAALPVIASMVAVIIKASRDKWRAAGARDVQTNDVTIKKPLPTFETREKPTLVTREDLESHLKRIDGNMRSAKEDTEAALNRFADSHNKCKVFQDLQHAANQKRLDDQVKALARMEGMVASVQHTVNTLLDLALNRKPNSRT